MNPIQKFDCKNCKHNERDICADCQVTDEGIPTRFEAKDGEIDLNWIGALMMFGAAVYQQEDVSKLLGDLKIGNYKEQLEAMEKEIREKQATSIVKLNDCCTYYPMNPVPWFESDHRFRETPSYQRDCYYFSEEQDMGAHIPCCDRIPGIEGYEPKNCNKDCPYYISRSKARELIDGYVEEKK